MKSETPYITEIERLKYEGRYDEAKNRISDLLKRHTDDYRLYEEFADICIFEGKVSEAKKFAKLAQDIHPESATGRYLLGYIHVTLGDFEKGVELLEEANRLYPNNSEILRNLGWGYTMLGNTDKGVLILRRALNIAPNDELIMEDLGVTLVSEGSVEEGESYLKKAGKESRIAELRSLMRP